MKQFLVSLFLLAFVCNMPAYSASKKIIIKAVSEKEAMRIRQQDFDREYAINDYLKSINTHKKRVEPKIQFEDGYTITVPVEE